MQQHSFGREVELLSDTKCSLTWMAFFYAYVCSMTELHTSIARYIWIISVTSNQINYVIEAEFIGEDKSLSCFIFFLKA